MPNVCPIATQPKSLSCRTRGPWPVSLPPSLHFASALTSPGNRRTAPHPGPLGRIPARPARTPPGARTLETTPPATPLSRPQPGLVAAPSHRRGPGMPGPHARKSTRPLNPCLTALPLLALHLCSNRASCLATAVSPLGLALPSAVADLESQAPRARTAKPPRRRTSVAVPPGSPTIVGAPLQPSFPGIARTHPTYGPDPIAAPPPRPC